VNWWQSYQLTDTTYTTSAASSWEWADRMTAATSGTTFVLPPGIYNLEPVGADEPESDSALDWLDREIREVCELAFA
jgi:hypothetical protein